jgi:hypothetical protein
MKPQGLGDDLAALASVVGDILNGPEHWVQAGVANLGGEIASRLPTQTWNGQSFKDFVRRDPSGMAQTLASAIPSPEDTAALNAERAAGVPGEQVFQDYLDKQNAPGAVKVAADIVTNPFTYFGGGLNLTKGLPVAAEALGAAPRLIQAFKWLNLADQAVANAPWKAVSGVTKGAFDVVGKVPLPPGMISVIGEGGSKLPAGNLAEWLGAPSAQSLYKEKVRNLVDMVNSLVMRGHRLERDLYEHGQFFNVPTTLHIAPADLSAAPCLVGNMQGKLLTQAASISDNPHAQILALETLDKVEQGVDAGFRRVAAMQQPGQTGTGADMRAVYNEMFRTIAAGQATIDRAGASAPVTAIDPGMATAVSQAYTKAIDGIMGALRYTDSWKAPRTQAQALATAAGQTIPTAPDWQIASQTTGAIRRAINNFRTTLAGHPLNVSPDGTPLLDLAPFQQQAQGTLTSAMAQADAAQRGLPPIAGLVPQRLERTAQLTAPQLQTQLGTLATDRKLVGEALREVWSNAQPGKTFPVALPTDWTRVDSTKDIYDTINSVLARLGEPPVTSVHEFADLPIVRTNLDPATSNKLESAIGHWPGGDMLSTDPYQLSIDAIRGSTRISTRSTRLASARYFGKAPHSTKSRLSSPPRI